MLRPVIVLLTNKSLPFYAGGPVQPLDLPNTTVHIHTHDSLRYTSAYTIVYETRRTTPPPVPLPRSTGRHLVSRTLLRFVLLCSSSTAGCTRATRGAAATDGPVVVPPWLGREVAQDAQGRGQGHRI